MPLSTRARLLATLPFVPALMLSAHTQIPTFRADTRLVLIRFAVSPKVGAFATDLRPEDIQILEDGIPQKPVVFSGARFLPRTLPLEITLLFDISGSVRSTGSFSSRVFRPELLDEFENASIAVYAFSDRLIRFTRPTRDRATLLRAMDDVMGPPPRDTPLFNSILETMRDAASSKPNAIRVLMVFSDGEANMLDRIYDKAVVRVAHELGFSIFPVVLPMSATARPKSAAAPVVIRNGRPPIIMLSGASSSAPDFVKLAEATGGQSYNVPWTDEILHSLLKRIAAHFQYDYVAGFPGRFGRGETAQGRGDAPESEARQDHRRHAHCGPLASWFRATPRLIAPVVLPWVPRLPRGSRACSRPALPEALGARASRRYPRQG